MASKTGPKQQLQHEGDRFVVSAQYEADNPHLEPERQDQRDMNRIPTEAAPMAPATPSKRSSDRLDEEE